MAKAIKDKKTVIVKGIIMLNSNKNEVIEEKVNELMDVNIQKIIVRNETTKTAVCYSKESHAQNYSKEHCEYEITASEKDAKELETNTTQQV